MFQQRKGVVAPVVASQNEAQAKEKLAGYVYEYLLHAGASKSAEMFKSEMLAQQNISQVAMGDPPGFLQDWWCVFWDLYSAAPERREKFEPSQEAKAFHEYGFIPPSAYPGPGPPLMVNGMHGPPQFGNGAPVGMGMPPNGPDGIMPGYFAQRGGQGQPGPSVQSNQASPIPGGGHRYVHPGARSGAPTPSNVMGGNPFPPGVQPPPHMFNEQMRMQAAAAQQRIPQNAGRIPANFQPMRHMRPGGYGPGQHPGQFLESPSGTPPFPQNPMMQQQQNGGMVCGGPAVSLMSSPGPGPPGSVPQQPTNPDGSQHDPRFNMSMMPGASSFGMSHDGSGTPTSSNPTSVQGINPNANNMAPNPNDNPGGQLQSLLNGSDSMDMKQSPASTHGGNVNGGTPGHSNQTGNPGSVHGGGGPGSVAHGPSSVHSQSGAPNSVSIAGPNSHQTPTSEAPANMDFQMNPSSGDEEISKIEISKIKASLINDFQSQNYQ